MWIVDAAGQPVGVLVQRGHAALGTGAIDARIKELIAMVIGVAGFITWFWMKG